MTNNIVDTICKAWINKNPELLREILSDKFEWQDSPFEQVISNEDLLIKRWNQDIDSQHNIEVTWEIINETIDTIVAHWQARFDRHNAQENLDGIFVIEKTNQNKLTGFRMWWVNNEAK